jgi:hypothetical protein
MASPIDVGKKTEATRYGFLELDLLSDQLRELMEISPGCGSDPQPI